MTPDRHLTRAERIRSRPEFLRIQASSARVTTRHLLVLFEARGDDGPARVGVVASRKVGPAVARNRAKRLVREAFRLHKELFAPGIDAVIIVRPGTHLLALRDLEGELTGVRHHLARRAAECKRARPSPSAAAPLPAGRGEK